MDCETPICLIDTCNQHLGVWVFGTLSNLYESLDGLLDPISIVMDRRSAGKQGARIFLPSSTILYNPQPIKCIEWSGISAPVTARTGVLLTCYSPQNDWWNISMCREPEDPPRRYEFHNLVTKH